GGFNIQFVVVEKQDFFRRAPQGMRHVMERFFIRLDLANQMRRKMLVESFAQWKLVHQTRPVEGVGVGESGARIRAWNLPEQLERAGKQTARPERELFDQLLSPHWQG